MHYIVVKIYRKLTIINRLKALLPSEACKNAVFMSFHVPFHIFTADRVQRAAEEEHGGLLLIGRCVALISVWFIFVKNLPHFVFFVSKTQKLSVTLSVVC